ncbi:GNAT family N-acetyltransferase [Actinopolymorpha singaporensis]|uniref:Ribosomal protein S18 acetylase RimI n=1 Tax=Actinopolymorpha singaporensis TaxID=117157 RepID=A0A1H1NPQ7_9ACTN|nr:GNAT family N-acetyltransferase [Actinopolymorpha singaporensis]SDS01004.1 Ribosomal protein S18 acetylase RimI [Actinopolymorpha singaporensis]
MAIEIRESTSADIAELAKLRWRDHFERRLEPDEGLGDYVRGFTAWWERRDDFLAAVAVDGQRVVGMGFLALAGRVPVPGAMDRRTGDIQSVYVQPEFRNQGVGSMVVRTLVDLGRERGCSRVTVHSGSRAVPVYERAGFQHHPQLMVHPLTD